MIVETNQNNNVQKQDSITQVILQFKLNFNKYK